MKYKLLILYIITTLIFCFPVAPASAEPGSETVSVANLAIPETLGKVNERFHGTSDRWIINIQDVHAHFTAQENIGAIIEHLQNTYGIDTVAFEGGWENTSYQETRSLPTSREKHMLTRALLEEEIITGPAHAAIFASRPVHLIGIENPELYLKNRDAYLEYFASKDKINAQIKEADRDMRNQKATGYNSDLRRFDSALEEFRLNSAIDEFVPQAARTAREKGVNLSDLKQVQIFIDAHAIEKILNKDKLAAEAARLMQTKRQSHLSFEELLRHGKFTAEQLQYAPETKHYLELIQLQDQLSHEDFFEQIETMIQRVKASLFISDAEKALDERSERYRLAKKIITFKATPADIKTFEDSRSAVESEMEEMGLAQSLALGIKFYGFAKDRDQIFFDKINSDQMLTGKNIAIVTGGFHTDGLSQKLKKAGISYMVITPSLGKGSPDEDLYLKRLSETVTADRQTLSALQNRISDAQDHAIAGAINALIHGDVRDLREAVQRITTLYEAKVNTSSGKSFLDIPAEEQKAAVQAAWDKLTQDQTPMTLGVLATSLAEILKNSKEAKILIDRILANPARTVVVGYDSFLDIPDVISDRVSSRNLHLSQGTDWQRALRDQRPLRDALSKRTLAIIDNEFQNDQTLILHVSAVSLLLYPVLIEQGWQYSLDDPQTQSLIEGYLHEIITQQDIQLSA
ncbi:MAG: hypothetical protein H6757_03165 [Candidatus Omnitrophica bacterium]|nr:hypothetical protein [Candidatus Omnitrophota bacterium]